jgi:tRNA A22 N-methylase
MKNEDTKRVLEDLRRQIESLGYYLSDMKVIEDRKMKQNLFHAQQTAKDIQYKLGKNLRNLDSEIHETKSAEIDESLRVALGSVNSPNEKMIKARDFNMNIRKSTFNKIKTANEVANEKRTGSKED